LPVRDIRAQIRHDAGGMIRTSYGEKAMAETKGKDLKLPACNAVMLLSSGRQLRLMFGGGVNTNLNSAADIMETLKTKGYIALKKDHAPDGDFERLVFDAGFQIASLLGDTGATDVNGTLYLSKDHVIGVFASPQ